jgi:hypothetical protein
MHMARERRVRVGGYNRTTTGMTLQERIDHFSVKRDNGCIDWIGYADKERYGRMRVSSKLLRVIRVVYTMHNGEIPEGLVVRHVCDNPACINIEHLEIGTNKDNIDDRTKRGRGVRGEKSHEALLTEAAVLGIRSSTESRKILAARYGVHTDTIGDVIRRKSWKHVT